MFVVGVNPVLHADQIPVAFPHRDQLVRPVYLEENGSWLEGGNSVIIAPSGTILAGPVREKEDTLIADLDLGAVFSGRRHMDPSAITTARTYSASTSIPPRAPRSSSCQMAALLIPPRTPKPRATSPANRRLCNSRSGQPAA